MKLPDFRNELDDLIVKAKGTLSYDDLVIALEDARDELKQEAEEAEAEEEDEEEPEDE